MNVQSKTLLTAILGFGAMLGAPSAQANSIVVANNQTYTFTGSCGDCVGQGIGTLTLSGSYVPGNSIAPNFISFVYNSSILTNYTILSTDAGLNVTGSLPASLPGPASILIFTSNFATEFSSNVNGNWCTGNSCRSDFGSAGTFAAATPEPATLLLSGFSLLGLGLASMRRRISRR